MVHLLGGHFGVVSHYLIWCNSNCYWDYPGLGVRTEHEELELVKDILYRHGLEHN